MVHQGWPAWPECRAPNTSWKCKSTQQCLSDTQGQRSLQGSSHTQIQMFKWAGDPQQILRCCDPSLEEVKSRSPACSLPKAQAALEEAGEGLRAPLYCMKRVSTTVIRRTIRQQKRLRKTGKPKQGYHHLQDQPDQSVCPERAPQRKKKKQDVVAHPKGKTR